MPTQTCPICDAREIRLPDHLEKEHGTELIHE